MPSIVWDRDTSDAVAEPYEYRCQEQFAREAKSVLDLMTKHYENKNCTFKPEEKTKQKAIWMLQVDALTALKDIIWLIGKKKHRLAVRLFRDVVETLDNSIYFLYDGEKAEKALAEWYENEIVLHRQYRKHVEKTGPNKPLAEELRNLHQGLSKYTHRSYNALCNSYLMGKGDTMYYDGFEKNDDYALPEVISMSLTIAAQLIKRFFKIAVDTKQITKKEKKKIWKSGLEKETIQRRFGNGPGQIIRTPPIRMN